MPAEGINEESGHNPAYCIKQGKGGVFLAFQINYGMTAHPR